MGHGGREHGAKRLAGGGGALGLVVVVAALLRFVTLDVQSFSDDELFTAWLVDMSFGDMLSKIADTEATPPLFYATEWLFSRVFGSGEVGMRILPALAGTLVVPVVYATGALGASRTVGLAGAAFVAVNPFLVWYSQEARAYALLILFVALALLGFVAAERGGDSRALAGWAAAAIAAVATHYFALFLVAPQGLWLLARGRGGVRSRAFTVTAPALAGLPLLALALHQRSTVSDPGGLGDSKLIERIAAVPKNFLVGFSIPAEAVVSGVVGVLALAALVLALRREPTRRFAVCLALLAACGVAIPVALSLIGLDYVSSRNVVAALIPLALLFACGFVHGRTGRAVLAGVTVLSVATLIGVALDPEYQRRDWRSAARALGPAHSQRLLVFSPSFSNPGPFRVYFGGESDLVRGGEPLQAREIAIVALAQKKGFGPGAPEPPSARAPEAPPGFARTEDRRTDTYRLVRFRSSRARTVAPQDLLSLALRGTPAAYVEQDARR